MDVTGPAEAQAGTTAYFTASGFGSSTTFEAEASFEGDSLPVVVTARPAGTYQICLAIPSGRIGSIDIKVGDGNNGAATTVSVY